MARSTQAPLRVGLAVGLTAALFAVLMIPVTALAQRAGCNGQTITVDLALGQVPTDGDDVIAGTDGPDAIAAGAGDDVICGLGGDDLIYGQAGDDTILGGDGADKLRGGAGNDTVLGGDGADDVSGGSGNDDVRGEGGADTKVRGGTGDDVVNGGEGNDELVAGNGGEDDVYGGLGDDKVTGGPRPDILRGEDGNDELRGHKGADTLLGGTGDDELFGGPQPDIMDGGTGFDMCNGGTTGDGAVESDLATNCEDPTNVETIVEPTPAPTPTSVPGTPAPIPPPLPAVPEGDVASGGSVDGGPPIIGPPGENPPPQAGLLTAADIDDNLNFEFFTDYLSRQQQQSGLPLPGANLTDRLAVRLLDGSRNALSNARVAISQGDTIFTVHANAEGILYLFPDYVGLDPAPSYNARITDVASGVSSQIELDATELGDEVATDLIVIPTTPDVERRQSMDVAFVIDATGSMGDEIAYLKAEFSSIVRSVEAEYPNVDMRFALVVYRDIGDEYVTRAFDFNTAEGMLADLERQSAAGGGDIPEAMEAALQVAADGLTWRDGDVSRVAILNADAPPHAENLDAALNAVERLREKGVRLYPLAASGVGDTAEYLMRIMAATTGGRHLFLTDDSGIGGAHQEPVVPCYVVTRLDQLLQRTLESELAGERVEPSDNDIIRMVGDYDNGECGDVALPDRPTPTPTPVLPPPPIGPTPSVTPAPPPPGVGPTPTPTPQVPPSIPVPPPPGVPIGSATLGGPHTPQFYVPIESFVIAESDPEQITVTFWGGPEACVGATAIASALGDQVLLAIIMGGRTDVGDIACPAIAVEHQLTIQLTEGLDGREVVPLLIPVPA